VRTPDAGEIAAQVHTHGTRLTRLARLLGIGGPETAAADALAATLRRPSRRHDAHEGLLIAARAVGSLAVPPLRDDARLQGWLDQAELDTYAVDLPALVVETRQRLQLQQAARQRRRLRNGAGMVAVALVVSVGLLWPDTPAVESHERVEGSGMLYPNNPDLNGGDPNAVIAPDLPARGHRIARDVELGGAVLSGRTIPIMSTSLPDGAATLLALTCTTAGGLRATCLVLAPEGVPLFHVETNAVLALLPAPDRSRLLVDLPPTVLRGSTIGTLASQTLLVEVTSPEVATALVTYTDGSQVTATRFPSPGSARPLFVARNKDVMPASVTYLDEAGRTLAERSLSTVTS
jgi:hypothetical protein